MKIRKISLSSAGEQSDSLPYGFWTPPADYVFNTSLALTVFTTVQIFELLTMRCKPEKPCYHTAVPGAQNTAQDLWLHLYLHLTLKLDVPDPRLTCSVNRALQWEKTKPENNIKPDLTSLLLQAKLNLSATIIITSPSQTLPAGKSKFNLRNWFKNH